jgi:ribonucleoside-diphosphate reductase alpha chain
MTDKTYTVEEVREATLKYFDGDELATDVFFKYVLQRPSGEYEERDPDDLHHRLAREFARIEKKYPNPMSEQEIYELFKDYGYVIPQGSPQSGVGNPYQIQSLSNCFCVDAPADSYGGVMKTDEEQVQIMKRRGGVGFDISTLRPKGLATSNAAKTTDGIGVFMERFSKTCREVAQGGRRGAIILLLSVHHPQVETFINIKRDRKKVTGANVSVRLTDEFMRAVRDDAEYEQRFPVDAGVQHSMMRMVKARDVWKQIIDSAWECAEPGVSFWDTVLRNTPSDAYANKGIKTIACNPCGEIYLNKYSCCILMLLNVTKFIKSAFTKDVKFSFTDFKNVAFKAQRLMDDLVDLEIESIDRIIAKIQADPEAIDIKRRELELWQNVHKMTASTRRTGLGLTGVADAIAMLNVKYGSDESIEFVEKIYKALEVSSWRSSCVMAAERGAFELFDASLEKDHEFIQRILSLDTDLRQLYDMSGRRNIAVTTTSPAGSISCLTRTTSGIEPVVFLKFKRRRKLTHSEEGVKPDFVDKNGDKWQEYESLHPGLKRWMDITGDPDITHSPYYGATCSDIDWKKSIDMLAVAMRYVDHSISKTVNLPANVDRQVVEDVYMLQGRDRLPRRLSGWRDP